MWDTGGISEEEKEEVQRLILLLHAKASMELSSVYSCEWFHSGAIKQGILDKQIYNMLYLLHHHSQVNCIQN